MPRHVIVGQRRFTCLAPGLVRMEFSPTGQFEDRRSLIAYEKQRPIAFKSVRKGKGELCLDTGKMTIISRDHEKDFFPSNLEVCWTRDGRQEYWRYEDTDYLNLGGTVRSLDWLDKYSDLTGVHVADGSHPDRRGMTSSFGITRRRDMSQQALAGGIHGLIRRKSGEFERRTLSLIQDQYRYSPGILSQSGYFLLNDSITAVMDEDDFPVERNTPGTKDLYFFCYNDDYRAALSDFIHLTGRPPLPSKNIFGIWVCRWPAFDEKESKKLVLEFQEKGIPLSGLVLDMEWHKAEWSHWEWDEKMYPDPSGFIRWCHDNGLEVSLNDHPNWVPESECRFVDFIRETKSEKRVEACTYGEFQWKGRTIRKVDVNICDKKQALPFMRIFHEPLLKQGVDFWWVDGGNGNMNGASSQLVTNKICFENVEKVHGARRRGMLISRYGGMGSHRYGVVWTGDTACQYEVLQKECEFNIRAGHLGLAYISHDIGGFGFNHPNSPIIDPILYLRWLQFAVFNPVFRWHSFPGSGSRMPWAYGPKILEIAQQWLKFRNSLIPYIYSAARVHYETGVPLVRGLFFEHPKDKRAYRFDQFYFGSDLVVAPLLSLDDFRQVYLPEGCWYDYRNGKAIAGGAEFLAEAALEEVPLYAKAGSIIPRQSETVAPSANHVSELILEMFPGSRGSCVLYEDDGKSQAYQRGRFVKSRFDLMGDGEKLTLYGHAAQGKSRTRTRKIVIWAVLEKEPKMVLFGRKKLSRDALKYNPCTRRLIVSLPEIDGRKAFQLTVLV